jgi:glycosyltransferase involved in cell wall biosynthesis
MVHNTSTRRPSAPRVMQVVLALDVGGTERLVLDLIKRLSSKVEFSVACLDREGALARELTEYDIPVAVLGRRSGFRPGLARQIAHLASARGVDILHCHHYTPFVYGQLSAVLNRHVRVIFTEHGRLSDDAPSRKRRLVNPVLGRLGAHIFAVSHALREHMGAEGLPLDRIAVIHNGIDPGVAPDPCARAAARSRLGLRDSDLVMGTIARLDPVKDIAAMITAMPQLPAGTRLAVVGDGPTSQELKERAAALGLTDAVLFTGQLTDAKALLPAFDVYVNSSSSEGVSIAILEAMAACVPVVATAVGGTPEIIVDGESGRLVPLRDPVALAGAVLELLSDPARRRSIGQAGRSRVIAGFTLDRMLDAYFEAYAGSPNGPHVC